MLPLTNCRKCGYPACMAFAAAIRKGKALPEDCPDFADPISVCKVYPVSVRTAKLNPPCPSRAVISRWMRPRITPRRKRTAGAPPQTDAGSKAPLYDRYGIRIQYDLSPREIQVLRYLAEGASNPEISEALNISPHTVKSHVIHIFNKINVNDRTAGRGVGRAEQGDLTRGPLSGAIHGAAQSSRTSGSSLCPGCRWRRSRGWRRRCRRKTGSGPMASLHPVSSSR
jgi:hypothetical protein